MTQLAGLNHVAVMTTDLERFIRAEVPDNTHADALPRMFDRGHLDHIALTAESPTSFQTLRQRLVEHGASDGTIEDLGAFHSVWFTDPDGMHAELTLIVDPALEGIHAPRPLNVP